MERQPSKSSSLAQRVWNKLVPAAFDDNPLRRLQAGRTVAFGLAMLFWAPIFALIYYLLGSSRGAMMIGCAAGAVVLALVSLRWTKNSSLTGNIIAASVFWLMTGLAVISGGIQAASVTWLPAVVIIALVLCSSRIGGFWALACCMACLVLLVLPRMGFELTNDIRAEQRWVLDFAATCGIVLVAFMLTFLFKVSEARSRQALEIAREQSDQANRAKSTFLANMSHEIRTPLNAVLGMSELMRDTPLSRQQQEYMEITQDSGHALLALVDDILDVSRIEAGKLVLANVRFDLHKSLMQTLKALAVQAHKAGLELACHIDPSVPRHIVGDKGRLRQVILNLVGNAIKFTEKGEVALRVRLNGETSEVTRLSFAISDTGSGIPADRQEAIFQLFEQADMSMTRRFGGVGLGLAISSHLVQAMGGKLQVRSELGQGSTFELTIGFGRVAQDKSSVPAALEGQRALLVEDHTATREVLEEMLVGFGMVTQATAHAGEALEMITRSAANGTPHDLVLVESRLASGDSCKLAHDILHESSWGGQLIMMLTCNELAASIAKCEQMGVHDYLVKPIGKWELLDAIQGMRQSAESEDAIGSHQGPASLGRSLRVLLAEDSLINQKLAVELMRKLGHDVVVANNGREALTALESQVFDLILMDVQMPEMDGLEASRTIRNRERQTGDHIPIVAVTAHALPEDREKCLAAGMDDYLAKPVDSKSLAAVIQAVIKSAAPRSP